MNRKEKRLAKALGAHWVAKRASGLLEVCMGGEACGCREGSEDRRRAPRAEDRRAFAVPYVSPPGTTPTRRNL
jgi:hypothetical protein